MGIVHPGSELTPSKADLLAAWLPTQDWWPAGEAVEPFTANFRFDDPAGEVGIESFLLPTGAGFVHVPLTYRAAPLEGGTLVGELDHSALGHRWVYDAATDPVYIAEAAAVILEGRGEVTMLAPDGTGIPRRPFTAHVRGSSSGDGTLHVARLLPADVPDGAGTLTATWPDHHDPTVLAWLA